MHPMLHAFKERRKSRRRTILNHEDELDTRSETTLFQIKIHPNHRKVMLQLE
jgi:hypothetical protein